MSAAIEKGSILIHRVFDVGGEISLTRAERLLSETAKGPRLKFSTNTRKAVIITDAPLKTELGGETLKLPSGAYPVKIFARLWNYGVISITLELDIPPATTWDRLVKLAAELDQQRKNAPKRRSEKLGKRRNRRDRRA